LQSFATPEEEFKEVEEVDEEEDSDSKVKVWPG